MLIIIRNSLPPPITITLFSYNFENLQTKIRELEKEGKTVVTVFVKDKLVGIIAVADTNYNKGILNYKINIFNSSKYMIIGIVIIVIICAIVI